MSREKCHALELCDDVDAPGSPGATSGDHGPGEMTTVLHAPLSRQRTFANAARTHGSGAKQHLANLVSLAAGAGAVVAIFRARNWGWLAPNRQKVLPKGRANAGCASQLHTASAKKS
jgi:hypothetical protein